MSVGCNYCGLAIPDAEPHVCTAADDVAAAGDDLRDALHWETLIDRDLIFPEPPAADWRPDPKDLA